MNISRTQSPSFNGILYCNFGSHISKGINCCPHGDAKFIKTINKIVKENPDDLKISLAEKFSKKLIIETSQTPEVNLFERLFYIVDKYQSKAIKRKQEGKIKTFIYQLNEFEYRNIKFDYKFIRKKTLKTFEKNILERIPEKDRNFLNNFFNGDAV